MTGPYHQGMIELSNDSKCILFLKIHLIICDYTHQFSKHNYSIWGGPQNPRGSYSFPTHYFDGTGIEDSDFSENPYPNNGTSNKAATRLRYSEVEYYTMTPPSLGCSSLILPANMDVWRHHGTGEDGSNSRPVVCKGTYKSGLPVILLIRKGGQVF